MRYKRLSPDVEEKITEKFLRETGDFPFCGARTSDIEKLYRWAKYNTDVKIEEETNEELHM